jgi:PAP2 superfamily
MLVRARSVHARLLPHGPLDVVRQVLLFAVAYYGYRLVRGMVDDPGAAGAAFQHARELIGLERGMHVFIEPSVQAWAEGKSWLIDGASWIYINAQTSVTLGALLFLYFFHNRSFYFVRNMFMVAMAIALVGYMVFPAAPPRFFPEWGFFDAVSDFTHVDHDSVTVDALFNPYAAVPSMHVCFALMIGIPLARLCHHRAARLFWAFYPLLITFVIVVTANHFLADAFLGSVTAGLGALAARWLARTRPAVWAFTPGRGARGVAA